MKYFFNPVSFGIRVRFCIFHHIKELFLVINEVVTCGGITSFSFVKILYYQLNSRLEVTQQTEMKTFLPVEAPSASDICTTNDGNILFQLSYRYNDFLNRGFYLVEYSPEGKIVQSLQSETGETSGMACITARPDSGFIMFMNAERYSLDPNFNFLDTLILNIGYPNYNWIADVLWENDSILLMSVPYYGDNNKYCMGLSRTRYGREVIDEKRYDDIPKWEIFPYYNSFDTIGNYIYLAANTNFYIGMTYYNDTSGVRIVKANRDFSVKWDKTYRFDSHNYLYSIIATRDGGCLVAGTRHELTDPGYWTKLYLLKVDSLGNYNTVSVPEGQGSNPNVTVYPNPGTTELIISFTQSAEESVFNLYSLSGQKVLSSRVTPTQNTICTAALPKGLYLWEWVTQNQVIERGKWVKE